MSSVPAAPAARVRRPSVVPARRPAPLPIAPRPRVVRIGGDYLLSLFIAECAS